MSISSEALLERLCSGVGANANRKKRTAFTALLERFGQPQNHMPPVFHVAGTNGKGSTCAFLRAMLEAAGYRVHVYTSPHLVAFHERIRVAGALIDEASLAAMFAEIDTAAQGTGLSYFEASTLAAFLAFSRTPADFTLLETGMGGRYDATNTIDRPLATLITRLSFDHREYLGETIEEIAAEKAGIMRAGVPCFVSPQPEAGAIRVLRDAAASVGAPLLMGDDAWSVSAREEGFTYRDADCWLDLPAPALLGPHQFQNAGLALAALSVLPEPLPDAAVLQGLARVEWPARLQPLYGPWCDFFPAGADLWLDGGHNDSAGEVLAAQIDKWRAQDGDAPRPLYIVLGMLTTKRPQEFLAPFAARVAALRTVPVPDHLSYAPETLAALARDSGIAQTRPCADLRAALTQLASEPHAVAPRVLICGSLYLAGQVLALRDRL